MCRLLLHHRVPFSLSLFSLSGHRYLALRWNLYGLKIFDYECKLTFPPCGRNKLGADETYIFNNRRLLPHVDFLFAFDSYPLVYIIIMRTFATAHAKHRFHKVGSNEKKSVCVSSSVLFGVCAYMCVCVCVSVNGMIIEIALDGK